MAEDNPFVTGSPVKDFIANTLKQIKDGLQEGKAIPTSEIEFDLNITETNTAQKSGGGIEINNVPVLVVGGKETANAQRVRFKALFE